MPGRRSQLNRGDASTPNRPQIADGGPIDLHRPGTHGFVTEDISTIYRRCIADSRSMLPSLVRSSFPTFPHTAQRFFASSLYSCPALRRHGCEGLTAGAAGPEGGTS
eukprot:6970728-Pyramimonas_sp.AAC.1